MSDELKTIETRFRAYTLKSAGSSFSYATKNDFVLIEARAPEDVRERIFEEMNYFGHKQASILHITSWDTDHCNSNELEWILEHIKPKVVEYPWYNPEGDMSIKSLDLIIDYKKKEQEKIKATAVTPQFVKSLSSGNSYKNIIFHPKEYSNKANDNSIIKFFRSGMFNVQCS